MGICITRIVIKRKLIKVYVKFKKEPTLSGKMLALSINEIKKWYEEMQISLQLYITEHNLSEYI